MCKIIIILPVCFFLLARTRAYLVPSIAELMLKVQLCVRVLDALSTYFNKHSMLVLQFIS